MASLSHWLLTLRSELSETFHPEKSFKFPKRAFGKKNEKSFRTE